MRTTLTLDDDVARLLQEVLAKRKGSHKSLVNDALRAGLAQLLEPPAPRQGVYRIEPVSLGPPRLPDVDNIAEVIAVAEGDEHR